ncbi:hypothetical protein N566_18265 [Streptomycetaceae bacterium MP113-05]|nr:hypothetical protein N566_18265 [Streptomycetaceae bacterium MP113-05]
MKREFFRAVSGQLPAGMERTTELHVYRTCFAAIVVLLAGQGLLIGVFAFLFYPLTIEGFAPLDEPATSVRSKIAFVVVVGVLVEAATVWIIRGLLRSTLRGLPAGSTLRWALAAEVALLVGAFLADSPSGAVGTGLILVLLAVCHGLETRRSLPLQTPR